MFYLVALGNPGDEYESTRHNVGWMMLDKFLISTGSTDLVFSAKYQGRISRGLINKKEFTALYPDTFMNHSGSAVKKLVKREEIGSLIILHDEVALPLGEIKISIGRGDGGHNGVRSIIKELDSNEFVRIRIGVAQRTFFTRQVKRPSGEKLAKFVLGKFTKREITELDKLAQTVNSAVKTIMESGAQAAMNRYNG